jgi:hypothetical protein
MAGVLSVVPLVRSWLVRVGILVREPDDLTVGDMCTVYAPCLASASSHLPCLGLVLGLGLISFVSLKVAP